MSENESRQAFEDFLRRQNACVRLSRQMSDGAYRTITVQKRWILWKTAVAFAVGKTKAEVA